MEQNLMNKIEENKSKMSKGQLKIASYINEHSEKAAFMTALKLSEVVGVSESTIVRFADKLGYDGYPELHAKLQEMVKARLTSVQRIEMTSNMMNGNDVLTKIMTADMEKIRITMEKINRQNFDEVVDAMISAKRIYILGVRSSSALAGFLGFYFDHIFDNVRLVHTTSVSEMFEQIIRVGDGDLVIGISFPRYSSRTVKAMEYANDKGAKTLAITDSNDSPIAQHAHYILTARSDMVTFVDSLVAPLSLINALVVAVGLKRRGVIEENFAMLEQIWDDYGVYEKQQ